MTIYENKNLEPFSRGMKPANAVAAIISTDKNEILLQLRDSKPTIFYPNYWGCFGGAVEIGEADKDAIVRELWEELGLEIFSCNYFTKLSLDFLPIGGENVYRTYFHLSIKGSQVSQIKLGEGSDYVLVPKNKISNYLITPYDKFALDLYFASIRQ